MMGCFQSRSRPFGRARAALATAAFLIVSLDVGGAGPVAAEDTVGKPTARAAEHAARVSMSPDDETTTKGPAPPASARRDPGADDPLPLTRAAARHRIDTISPAPWLARYGSVSIGRRN